MTEILSGRHGVFIYIAAPFAWTMEYGSLKGSPCSHAVMHAEMKPGEQTFCITCDCFTWFFTSSVRAASRLFSSAQETIDSDSLGTFGLGTDNRNVQVKLAR
jgi:hypothetical protein